MPEALSNCSLELDANLESEAELEAGERSRLRITARNAGTESSAPATLVLAAPPALLLVTTSPHRRPVGKRSLAPFAGRELAFAIPSLLAGEACELAVDVYALAADASATIAVRCDAAGVPDRDLALRIVAQPAFDPAANRIEFAAADALAGTTVAGRVVVTNTGSAAAEPCSVHVDGDLEDVVLEETFGALAPQERRVLRFTARIPRECSDGSVLRAAAGVVAADAVHRIGEASIVARGRPRFEGRIDAGAPGGAAGESVAWILRVENAGDAPASEVRVALACEGAVYVPGSTSIQGNALLDVRGTSPLWSSDGLAFERVVPGCSLEVAWTAILEPGAANATAWARILYGENEALIESPGVRVDAVPPGAPPFDFVVRGVRFRPGPLPVVAAPPVEEPAERTAGTAGSRGAVLDANAARHLGALSGLMRHVWALGVLCADGSAELIAVRTALRSVFDRLSIKLRIPQYRVGPEDVLDPAAWEALEELEPGLERTRLTAGLHSVLRALGPAAGDALAAAALASYRAVFSDVLRERDDAAILAELCAPQPGLDQALDAVLACEADAVLS